MLYRASMGHPILKLPNTNLFFSKILLPRELLQACSRTAGCAHCCEISYLIVMGMRHADERLSSILYPDSGIRVRGPNCPARGHHLNVVPRVPPAESLSVQPFVSSCSVAHRQTFLFSSSPSRRSRTALLPV